MDLQGDFWAARKIEDTYIVSVKDQAGIIQALTDFIHHQGIRTGKIVGIGMVDMVALIFFDPAEKKYFTLTLHENMASDISGFVSSINGKPVVHLHIALERKNHIKLTGQLSEARALGTVKFFFHPLKSQVSSFKNEKPNNN